MRLGCSDAALVRRARYGDRGAARQLATRHLDRISLLATVVAGSPTEASVLARQGFALAVRGEGPFDAALLRAFGTLAARTSEPAAARGRLLVLLVDIEGRAPADATRLLGVPAVQAKELRLAGGVTAAFGGVRACRGWGLASGRADLTPGEQAAGEGHLALCRHCYDRRARLDKEHHALLGRAAGVAGLLGAGQVAALTTPFASTAGGLVTGKAAVGLIGALGAAVIATGGTVAVQHPAPIVSPVPSGVASVVPAGASPTPGVVLRHVVPRPPSPSARVRTSPPSAPRPSARAVLPSGAPVPAPSLDLPTKGLPLPLPTSLPLPLPSLLPLPLPTDLLSH